MATQGPNSGGTFANVDEGITGGSAAWTNASNAAASDGSYATVSIDADIDGGVSQMLYASNLGFSIPTGATIDGIVAEAERKVNTGSNAFDAYLAMTKDGVDISGFINPGGVIPTSDTYQSWGSSSYLWGQTWTVAEINASSFGLLYSATTDSSTARTVSVDHIRITVYYTPAAGGGIPRGAFSKPFRGPFGGSIGW